MSFSGHAFLWLHVVAAIFAIGPGTAAIMSTPRQIRKGNAVAVTHLYRTTRIYAAASLLVLVFGLVLTQIQHDFSKWWVSASITLFVVAMVLLVLILRDQRKAIAALEAMPSRAPARSARVGGGGWGEAESTPRSGTEETAATADGPEPDGAQPDGKPAPAHRERTPAEKVAAVERGRIASLSGIVGLIWLVIVVFMVWQ